MKQLIFEIKTRLGKNFPFTLWALIKLYFAKSNREGFFDKRNEEKIDVVIPTTDKDFELLALVIESLKNVGNKINNIYIVAPAKESIINFCKDKNIIFFDELKVFGFGKESITPYMKDGYDRRGWLFQQFLKYGMRDYIQMENYLVLDSDTVLTNVNTFIENGKFIFFKNTEWNKPYFVFFRKLFGYEARNFTSFTSHMMIFNKHLLDEMLAQMDKKHQDKWYNVIQKNIDKNEMSSVSDYEDYGQWMFINHRDLMAEKPLYNKALSRSLISMIGDLEKKYGKYNKTISFHSYIK